MKKLLIILILSISLIPARSMAADEYKLLEPLPCLNGVTDPSKCKDGVQEKIEISSYILYVYKMFIALAVFLAIVMIIWGGFLYITSETPFKIEDGRGKIQNAVLGLAMVLVSYLILLTVDPRLVNIDTEIPKITPLSDASIKSLEALQNRLAQESQNMSVDNQLAIGNINTKIKELETEKKDIKAKFDRGEIGGEDANVLTTKADNSINKLQVSRDKIVIGDIGINNFKKAIDVINDSSNYTQPSDDAMVGNRTFLVKNAKLSDDTESNLNTALNTISDKYSEYITKVSKTDPEAAQLLKKQKDFLLAEIKTQKTIAKDSILYKNANGLLDGNDRELRGILKPYLLERLDVYEKELENPKATIDPSLAEQYKILLQQRVVMIENALNPPAK